jgi:hypothetical protein
MNGGTAEAWLITFTQALRSALPSGQYLITHARKLFSSLAQEHL